MKNDMNVREAYAGVSLAAAVGFGVAGMAIPPAGEVDGSTLTLIGQFLVMAATLMGLGDTFRRISDVVRSIKQGDGGRRPSGKAEGTGAKNGGGLLGEDERGRCDAEGERGVLEGERGRAEVRRKGVGDED